MAEIFVEAEGKRLCDAESIRAFLAPFGIWYEHWAVEGRLPADPSDQDILTTYAPEIERLKQAGGFVTADVINVKPDTPNLDTMLNKFNREHTHAEDEVRFTVSGKGLFHIHPQGGPVFAVTVESGDLINVPAGTKHWFNLCSDRHIRCIRLFQEASGWTPVYTDTGVDRSFTPLCFGPRFLARVSEPLLNEPLVSDSLVSLVKEPLVNEHPR